MTTTATACLFGAKQGNNLCPRVGTTKFNEKKGNAGNCNDQQKLTNNSNKSLTQLVVCLHWFEEEKQIIATLVLDSSMMFGQS